MDRVLGAAEDFPEAHLVVGIVGPVGRHYDGTLGLLFEQLIEAQGAEGVYGVGEIQRGEHLSLHCAFQLKRDADRFATALQATAIGRYPGFASQRQFLVNPMMVEAISSVLQDRAQA